MKHQPVVTNFRVRPVTYPEGHWMNRFWGPIVRTILAVVVRVPFYRYILRAGAGTGRLLASGRPVIFACTHQDIFDCFNGLPRLLQERPLAAMVSYSRDGSLAAMGLQALGYEVVRGSSSHGGGEGLLVLRGRASAGTSIVMVCDGPKAPLGDVKPGVVHLAARTGAPIVPIRAWGLVRLRSKRSWTKAAISAPFAPVVVCAGLPIDVPEDLGDPRPYQLRVATALAELAVWSSEWAHGPARAPFTVSES